MPARIGEVALTPAERAARWRASEKGKASAEAAALRRRSTPELARAENDRLIEQRTGWSRVRSDAFMLNQGGRCAICLRSIRFSGRKGLDRACRDHNHDTKQPRALLCLQCNTHLGGYEEAKKFECVQLDAFDRYLEEWT